MGTFIYKDGNGALWGWPEIYKYKVVTTKALKAGRTKVTMQYDIDEHGASADHPKTIRLTVKRLKLDAEKNLQSGVVNKIEGLVDGKVKYIGKSLNVKIGPALKDDGKLDFEEFLAGGHKHLGSEDSGAGSWNGDLIMTSTGNDTVKAGKGDDYIVMRGGNDKIYGGEGTDVVLFSGHRTKRGIFADLGKGEVHDGSGNIVGLFDVEGVRGTNKADRLIGSNEVSNKFNGLKGNDRIIGGSSEKDEARYHRDAAEGGKKAIVANLRLGKIKDGFGDTDTIKGIERVRGTDKGDTFIDNGVRNGFTGMDGDDTFYFTGGNDWAEGGKGADKFVYRGKFGWDYILDFNPAEGDRIKIIGASSFRALKIAENSKGNAIVKYKGQTIELEGYDQQDVGSNFFLF